MKKNKRYFFPSIKKTIFFIITLFLIYSLSKNILDYQKKILFFEAYQKELHKEQEKNKKLKSDIIKNYDYYTVERNIRQKLNLLQPNEFALILPQPSPTPKPIYTQKKTSLEQWQNLFFRVP
ncbi:MAG TPA: septum formation initiator family protein [Patescibacteria group bacterium]|nr:septum formation initiator family protein [Patescibacteria group bacterium]